MHNQACDVLVVGAGPAGAVSAAITSSAGFKTILLERKPVVGSPVKCAEYIPIQLAGEVTLQKRCIVQEITGMKTFIGGKLDDTSKARGYMIHRDLLDKSLVDHATASGASLMLSAAYVGLSSNGVALIKNRIDGSLFQITPQIIIGADGPGSKVAQDAGFAEGDSIPGVQFTLPLNTREDFTEVHFEKEFYGGYGWFFPKQDRVNIGLGMKRLNAKSISLKSILNNFVEKFVDDKRVANKILGSGCGWIPVSPRSSCVKDNILLAGDAAGHTHPITGAGVFAAVMCGKMAGQAAVQALEQQNLEILNSYDKDWQSLFGKTLKRASGKRAIMEENWGDFENTIRQTWVAYKAYYCE